MIDTWDEIEKDVKAVYGFERDSRPQDRAHAYIERRKVQRGFNDTAIEVAAMDLCRRSHALGLQAGRSGVPGLDRVAASVAEQSGKLLAIACELRGIEADHGD